MRHINKLAFPFIMIILFITGVLSIAACSTDVSASQNEVVEVIAEPICTTVNVVSGNNVFEIDKNTVTKEELKNVNLGRIKSIYPTIVFDDTGLRVTDYQNGNEVDIDALYNAIKSATPKSTIDVIDYTSIDDSPSYEYDRLVGVISPYVNFNIQYSSNQCINIYDLKDFITVSDNTITTDFTSDEFNAKVAEIVKEKTDVYNTYYNTWEFNSPVNGLVYVKSDESRYCINTYGSKVDFTKETYYVTNLIIALKSEENRVPYLLLDNGFELPNTYIEVSIKDQHLWYYVDGELTLESGVVTGMLGKTDTPVGVYQISGKCHGIAFDGGLYGKNWMRFTQDGHGLHDATWRRASDFENPETYINNGSHGCVNLPLDFSYELYDAVPEGTIVIIY